MTTRWERAADRWCRWFFLMLVAAGSGLMPSLEALTIDRLRCEFLIEPRGLQVSQPRLSWELASDQRGARQAAWQILAASTPELLVEGKADLWDSGRVESADTANISWDGAELRSNAFVHWKVRVWDEEDKPKWSESATWTMGLLAESEWIAEWIGLPAAEPEPQPMPKGSVWIWTNEDIAHVPAGSRRFRLTFEADLESLSAAQIYMAADDRYRLKLNGREIGIGAGTQVADRLEIRDFLVHGANTLAVEVTNDAKGTAGWLGLVELHDSDEGTARLITGADGWKFSMAGPAGWDKPDFDDSGWLPAVVVAESGDVPWGETVSVDASRALPARLVRNEFDAENVRRATVHLTGLGYHELWINGKKASDRVLEPALTQYDKRVPVSTYEVTELLRDGKNAIGVHLGNGRYHAPRLSVPTQTIDYGVPVLRAQLHLEWADGRTQIIASGPEWRVTDDGPVRENNDYDGEIYDARREQIGWTLPGFDDSQWQQASILPSPAGTPRMTAIPPIRVTEKLRAVSHTEVRPGVWIYDFGQNVVGYCRLQGNGYEGAAVTLRHAETLDKNGELYLTNMRGAKVRDRYIFSGNPEGEAWEPSFTYHGFRYVEMSGFPDEPKLDTITAQVVHTDLERVGNWESSDAILNQIYRNVRWGLRGNYLSVPVDCPQRDERQGWIGDRSAESRGEAYLFDIAAFYAKWLDDIRDSQREDGNVSDVCPAYWPLYSGSAVWPAAQSIVPETLYEMYGDKETLARHYTGLVKWLRFLIAHRDGAGLLPADPYGDWCAPPEELSIIHSSSEDVVTDKAFVANCYLAKHFQQAAWMSDLLGGMDSLEWRREFESTRTTIQKRWWNPSAGRFANGTQTSSVLPLAFDLVADSHREALAATLTERVLGKDNGHIGTGLIGAQWLHRTLSEVGEVDLAFKIATQTTYPSLGYMMKNGATTIWELWNGNTADPSMNSGNHIMLVGDLMIWLHENLAGIRPDPLAPGFARVLLKPEFPAGLDHVACDYHSLRGPIRSEWRRIQGTREVEWDVEIPANTEGLILIPAHDLAAPGLIESGVPCELSTAIWEDGHLRLPITSGRYRFRFTLP
jgi:alpha-L-rhamnosidase